MEKSEIEVERELYEVSHVINKSKKELKSEIKKEKKQNSIARIGVPISLFAAIITIYGASKSNSVVTEYLTDKKIYSTEEVTQTDPKSEYMLKIDGLEGEYIIEYEPWVNVGNNNYSREVLSYDVTNSNINKDNYLTSSLDEIEAIGTCENKYNPLYLDEYDNNIKEFVVLTQNPEDTKTYDDQFEFFTTCVETTYASVIALLSLSLIYKSKYNENILMTKKIYRKQKHGKKLSSKEKMILDDRRKEMYILYKNYLMYSQKFISEYEKYKDIINNDDLENKYQEILSKKL